MKVISEDTYLSCFSDQKLINSQMNQKIQIYKNNMWLSIILQLFLVMLNFGSSITTYWFYIIIEEIQVNIGLILESTFTLIKNDQEHLEHYSTNLQMRERVNHNIQFYCGIITFISFIIADILTLLLVYYQMNFIMRVDQNYQSKLQKANKFVRQKTLIKIIFYIQLGALIYWIIITSVNILTYYQKYAKTINFQYSFYVFIGVMFASIFNYLYFRHFKKKVYQKDLFQNLMQATQ